MWDAASVHTGGTFFVAAHRLPLILFWMVILSAAKDPREVQM
jgi:hypothetical protein